MATPNREAVFNALFAKLQSATFAPMGASNATTWVESSRRLKLWNAVDPNSQPAMFMTDHDEDYNQPGTGQPPKRFWLARAWVYVRTDGGQVGSTLLNTLLTAIEGVLTPDNGAVSVLTLGGQVYYCRIEGTVIKDPGDIDDQALMIIPIKMLVP